MQDYTESCGSMQMREMGEEGKNGEWERDKIQRDRVSGIWYTVTSKGGM